MPNSCQTHRESESLAEPGRAAFDRITQLARRLLRCPIVVLHLRDGQFSSFGGASPSGLNEASLAASLPAWVSLTEERLVVPDTRLDPRFCDHPLVSAETGIRFYAAAPLISLRGVHLGTLCILDSDSRPQGLNPEETECLSDLAALGLSVLEARLSSQALKESHDLLQTTLAAIGDGVIVTNAAARVTFINPVAEQITGWSKAEAANLPIEEVFHIVNETSREPVENPIARALQEGCVIGLANHTVLLTRQGGEVPIDDSAAPVFRDGKTVAGVLVFRDVTNRRMAERALQYSEDQYRATLENAPLGLVLTATDGRFIHANEAYRKLTGYTEEELPQINFISLTHPAEIENNRQLFQQLLREEIASYVLEKRIFRKDGELRMVRAHASLLRDAAGKPGSVIGLVEDITDRSHAEERLRFLAESIPQMVWTATPDGMLDHVNLRGTEYFGTPRELLLGAGWLNGVHPEDQAEAVQRWTEALATGVPYETEFRLLRGRDSSWRLHLVRALPFPSDGRAVTQWFGTCTDIEDQHREARHIEEDRKRWRDLLLQAPAAIAVLRGPEHRFEWVNTGYVRLVGQAAGALCGKTVLEALPLKEAAACVGLLDGVYQTGEPFHGQEWLLQLAGDDGVPQDSYVNFVCLPTRNPAGEIDGIFAHITDVTDTVAARKVIEEREIQFRTLAETIPHLTWMADETGHIFWYNSRWFNYTGTTLEEMQGWGWQKVHDKGFLPEVVKSWRIALTSGQPFEMIFPLRRADGEFRSFLTRVEPIRDSGGKVIRWFGTNTDIADQLRTEERLRRTNRELEEFSYVASHDMQEPLRMVNIYTELLLRDKDATPEEVETYSGFVSQGVGRMERLIQDLLQFSRAVHTEEITVGTADLAVAFEDAMSVLKIRLEESGAVVTVPALPMARGDTAQIAHVFQNLLSNALKYRKAGTAPQIQVGVDGDGEKWTVSVRDNGIGFHPQYAVTVFGLFKRLHKEEYAGTGLGLAICKRIVERYGGRMWAEAVEGEGATFYFSLPRAAGQ